MDFKKILSTLDNIESCNQQIITEQFVDKPTLSILKKYILEVEDNHKKLLTERQEKINYIAKKITKNILCEASYDSMVKVLKVQFPDNNDSISNDVKWAKYYLKHDVNIVWYLKLLKENLLGNNSLDMNEVKANLEHYFGQDIPKIKAYKIVKDQKLSNILNDLNKLEEEYMSKLEITKPVKPQVGDYKLIDFGNDIAWWFVDRGYCSEEGRSGKHCGNVVGKHEKNQKILSFRINGHVKLTFILDEGYLGETKANYNKKPDEKYHKYILELLLNPIIKGIKFSTNVYMRDNNFSIFDLSDNDIKIIEEQKPTLITDQIVENPIGLLKASQYIRADENIRNSAISKIPGLKLLINVDGSINNDNESWGKATRRDDILLTVAPETLPNYRDSLKDFLYMNPRYILECRKEIRNDFELLKDVIQNDDAEGNFPAIAYILPTTDRYQELCNISILHGIDSMKYIPYENKTYELFKNYLDNSKSGELNMEIIEYIPISLREFDKLVIMFIESDKTGKTPIDNIRTLFGYYEYIINIDNILEKDSFVIYKKCIDIYPFFIYYCGSSKHIDKLFKLATTNMFKKNRYDLYSFVSIDNYLLTPKRLDFLITLDKNVINQVGKYYFNDYPEEREKKSSINPQTLKYVYKLSNIPMDFRTYEVCNRGIENNISNKSKNININDIPTPDYISEDGWQLINHEQYVKLILKIIKNFDIPDDNYPILAQIIMIQYDNSLIHNIKNPHDDVIKWGIIHDPDFVKYIKNSSLPNSKQIITKFEKLIVTTNKTGILYVKQTPELQMLAVKSNIEAIMYMGDVCPEVQKYLLSRISKHQKYLFKNVRNKIPEYYKFFDDNNTNLNENKIIKLQSFLKNKGYNLGPSGIDGIVGQYTKNAIQQYQQDKENPLNELTFHGSQCTKDCSGHLAGHQWTNKHKRIANSHSNSFNQGSIISKRHQDSGKLIIRPSIRGVGGKFSKYPPDEVAKLKKRGLL